MPDPAPTNRASPHRTGWLIFAVAAALRLLYLFDSSDAPTFLAPIADAEIYCDLAHNALATGHLSPAFFSQPFFYPAFLTTAFALTHGSLLIVKILQAFIGAATCLLTFRLATAILPTRWAAVAGLITAFYGPLIFFDGELLGTGWQTFCTLALLLCLLEACPERSRGARPSFSPRIWLRLGLVAGLSILSSPTFLPFVAVALPWAAAGLIRAPASSPSPLAPRPLAPSPIRRFSPSPTLAFAALLLGCLLTLLPASLLSHRLTGSYTILPYSGGLDLYLGNNPNMDQTIALRPGFEWDSLTLLPARHGIKPGRETSRFFSRQATRYAVSKPVGFVNGLAHKSLHCLSSRELPRNEDIYVHRNWSTLLRLLVWRAGNFGFPFGLLLPLALLGLIHLGRRAPVPLVAFLILYTAAVILVLPTASSRIPLIPILAIAAAAGLAALVSWWPTQRRRAIAAGAGLALTATLLSLPGPFPQERASYHAEMCYGLAARESRQGRHDEAVALLNRAIAIAPAYADAYNSLGLAHERLNHDADAVAAFLQATRLHPSNIDARMNLGSVFYRAKDFNAAIAEFEQVAAQAKWHKESRKRTAMCLILQKRPAAAIPWLYAALQIDPNDAAAHNNLGSSLNATGNSTEAVKHFQSAILLDPDLDLAVDNLGAMLVGHGQSDQARLLYRAALARATTQGDPDRITHFKSQLNALK